MQRSEGRGKEEQKEKKKTILTCCCMKAVQSSNIFASGSFVLHHFEALKPFVMFLAKLSPTPQQQQLQQQRRHFTPQLCLDPHPVDFPLLFEK